MATNVLIVLDGTYRFAEPAATTDFTYTDLVGALTGAGMQVTKAHRQADATADIASFDFASSVDLMDFQVVWLIGFNGRNVGGSSAVDALGATQRAALARFMDAGGGVFATGDHDSIGADLCGYVLRVRAMRCWYGAGDPASPMPAAFPRNFPPLGSGRADTTQRNPLGSYVNAGDVWFENQSDSVPQPIAPTTTPAHPILRQGTRELLLYPDHMHEGMTLGEVASYDYTQSQDIDGDMFDEFPAIAGHRELPAVIATGQTMPFVSLMADTGSTLDAVPSAAKTVNTLSAYDGRVAGVGRIVTGSTFHHYVDINLTGDSDIDTPQQLARTGPDAAKGEGFAFAGAEATRADIHAVFVNITQWLARPVPALQLILERSTFGQDEATADPDFERALLVTVDGLKPSQFPGGGISTLAPTPAQLAAWAPTFTAPGVLQITPTAVDSDEPDLPERLQRITFIYRLTVVGGAGAFMFPGDFQNHEVTASLTSSAAPAPLSDAAIVQLTKAANPFMLDLADGASVSWLSSDLRVFNLVAGDSRFGVALPNNATRAQALGFLRDIVSGMTVAQFIALPLAQGSSALSPFATAADGRKVYNFAVARVRLNGTAVAASDVRVFFRTFTTQTTAALTYLEAPAGTPVQGYKRTAGAAPIALPGTNAAGDEWLSFPFFSATRNATPASQTDPDNVQDIAASTDDTFFGALVDNNLADPYLPPTPLSGAAAIALPTLMMGEHQCVVAQIEHLGTPIPSGANPATSDKLAQRNLALSEVANPGLTASRVALHTFEIEATPQASATLPPDELLLEWARGVPDGTQVRIHIPTWQADEVLRLADRLYPRHAIEMVDAQTIALPAGGIRYVPLPRSVRRQTGVLSVELPLGIKRGQRFDLGVRQITNRGRGIALAPRTRVLSREEADALLERLPRPPEGEPRPKQGVFDLGKGLTLVTDLSVLDGAGGQPMLIEQPGAAEIAAARRTAQWRQTLGAFQLGVPVSVKDDMLLYQLRLLSVFRWRLATLRPGHRWHKTLAHYVDLLADKVRALGADPFAVPPTPDGSIDWPPGKGEDPTGPGPGQGPCHEPSQDPGFEPGDDGWLPGTDGLPDPGEAKPGAFSGKVSGLLYDHFGDFEGFTLESYGGDHRRFFSRESAIECIAKAAWAERHLVTVVTVSAASRRVRRLLLRAV